MARRAPWFRAVVAAVLLLALELAVLGGVPVAGETGTREDEASVPSEIRLPRPRVGDEVRYTYRLAPRAEAQGAPPAISCSETSRSLDGNNLPPVKLEGVPYLDFRIEEPATVSDGRGGTVQAYAVHALQYGFNCEEEVIPGIDVTEYVDAVSLAPVASVAGRAIRASGPGMRYSLDSTQVRFAANPGHAFTFWACTPFAAWQGRELGLRQRHHRVPECDLPLYMFHGEDSQFEGGWGAIGLGIGFEQPWVAERIERVGGHMAVVFQWAGTHPEGQAELWLSPDFPYPLRYVVQEYRGLDSPGLNYDLTIELGAYKAGDRELPLPGDPAAFPARSLLPDTGLEFAARQPWGLDESGIHHAFPASAAWRWLSSNNATFASFLKRHPGAAVVQASYQEDVTEDRRTLRWGDFNSTRRTWHLVVSDGLMALDVSVTERTVWRTAAGLPGLPGQAGATENITYDVGGATETVVEDEYRPPPSRMPATLPTVAALWTAFESRATGVEPNRWGFNLRRGPHGTSDGRAWEGPTAQDWSAGVARRTRVLSDNPGDPLGVTGYHENETYENRELRYSDDGGTVEFSEAIERGSPAANAGTLSETELQDPLRLQTESLAAWRMPSAPAVAGASAVAVLVGFAVALLSGKGAKGLGFALLFSRVRPAEAADHPARRALLSAIEANPGIHFKELQRRSSLSKSSTQHHVAILLRARLIQERRDGGYVCYFPAGVGDPRILAAAPILRAEGARRLFATALACPGLNAKEVAARSGVQPSTANYHLHRLERAGLVRLEKGSGGLRIAITDLGLVVQGSGVAA
jgi:predicted transcriptional regulator